MKVIKPHGGRLVDREVTGSEREKLVQAAVDMPALRLDARDISELEMIAIGAYSPLEGFLDRSDYNSVCVRMRLTNDVAWPIPVTLSITNEQASTFRQLEDVALYQDDHLLAILHLAEKYRYDKEREAELVYRTTDAAHPGVRTLYNQGDWLLLFRLAIRFIARTNTSKNARWKLRTDCCCIRWLVKPKPTTCPRTCGWNLTKRYSQATIRRHGRFFQSCRPRCATPDHAKRSFTR